MGIDPYKVSYLERADKWLGPIGEGAIEQRGEAIASVRTDFNLIDTIPAQRGIRAAIGGRGVPAGQQRQRAHQRHAQPAGPRAQPGQIFQIAHAAAPRRAHSV